MKYENFRQALRYLLHIVEHNPNAEAHPAIQRLPASVRDQLMHNPDGILRELMASRTVKTPYTSAELKVHDTVPIIRLGSFASLILLSAQERKAAAAVVEATGAPLSQAMHTTLGGPIRAFTWVCLPNRPKHTATIYVPAPESLQGRNHDARQFHPLSVRHLLASPANPV